jgi:hypothetical protein
MVNILPTSLNEILDFKEFMETRHGTRIGEQTIDQTFVEDTYKIPVPEFVKAEYIFRTGFVASLMNSITQQAISFLPKVYTESKNKTSQGGADRVAVIGNKWCKTLSKQSIHPFRQSFKAGAFTRGEEWNYIVHNDRLMRIDGWQELFPNELPVHFIPFDPMVVFHEPSEEIDGKPKRVIVKFKRLISELHEIYPDWTPEETKQKEVEFWMYFDKDRSYAEADKKVLFSRPNPYGFVPFVHKYSGYGVETQSKDPALLAFTRTRMIRDRIKEDAKMSTEFNYNQSELVWKVMNLLWPLNTPVPADLLTAYSKKPGSLNILSVPQGVAPTIEDSKALGADSFAYRNQVRADLNAEHPLSMRGIASGTSGRQEDIMSSAGMSMYDSPIEATGSLWSEALDMAIQICSIPDLKLLPEGLQETDKSSYTELRVDIKRVDPTDLSRKAAEGDRRFQMGIIDLEELYVEYMGKTREQALKLKARVWIEQAMRNDPAFIQLITQTAAEEMGQEEKLAQIREMIQGGAKAINPTPQTGSKGGEQRLGNIKTVQGVEMADTATYKEPRQPPQGA